MPQPTDVLEPLAIVGFSIKFPGDANTSEAFWRMISEKRCASTDFPESRLNIDSFYHPDGTRTDSVPLHNAHFLREDIGAFDAPFFSLTPSEALSMDPQHRGLMECAYHALESAGIPLARVSDSKTGVFCGTFTDDYRISTFKDVAAMPKHAATGIGQNFTANRLSWAFNLKGPSLQIDTACSSSMIALDLACQSLRSGDSTMALVGGSNIISSVETTMALSAMGFLSPDGRCFSFDERGNGYARGEGFGVLVVKRLGDAVRDGDIVRAVVRSSGSNQNGRNRSITQTSKADQVQLMHDTYKKAGLDPAVTRFVEAHGTGTAVGDPNEANAIGEAFGEFRSADSPLYIGAVKSNIGHLEGASGIAGIVKTILALEKGTIPPNANLQKLNPRIKAKAHHLEFPTSSVPWPTDVYIRRASINSFGFGGSNAHVVLDDAASFLHSRRLSANHLTTAIPTEMFLRQRCDSVVSMPNGFEHDELNDSEDQMIRLLPLSSFNEHGLKRLISSYSSHLSSTVNSSSYLSDLAYTLGSRRSHLQSRSFALINAPSDLAHIADFLTKPLRSSSKLGLGFVFTGQGAQYAGMGRELLKYPEFQNTFIQVEEVMKELGCPWSLSEELMKPSGESRIDRPEFSQPLCTALQISLLHLLKACGLHPGTVVGHSSGEIAAAYAAGALSFESACKVAYFRGCLTAELCASTEKRNGGMLAVGLSEAEIHQYFAQLHSDPVNQGVVAGCINSPRSITVSGDAAQIDALKTLLDADGVFNRRLKVDVAYHSSHMAPIASHYADALRAISPGEPSDTVMVSSVTGQRIGSAELCTPEYWVRNLVSPVRFSDAVGVIANARPAPSTIKSKAHGIPPTYNLVELGPHSTLQGPIRDTLAKSTRGKELSYLSALKRNTDPVDTVLQVIGKLWCHGYPVDLSRINRVGKLSGKIPPKLLPDLPEYPFDHSQSYLHRPRLHNDFLHRRFPTLDLLGAPVIGFNPLEPAWRKFIRINDTPWVEDHQINNSILYPAAGMLVMAIEAAKLMAPKDGELVGFRIKEASFDHSLAIPSDDAGVETQLHLRPSMNDGDKVANSFDFSLTSYVDNRWLRNCHGAISIEVATQDAIYTESVPRSTFHGKEMFEHCSQALDKSKAYDHFNKSGFQYGPAFQGLSEIRYDENRRATANVELFPWAEQEEAHHHQDHVIHPTTFDALAQLALIGLTNGARETPPVNLPTAVRNLFVSAQGLSHPMSASVKVYAATKLCGERHNEFSITAVDPDTGRVLLEWELLETTNIGKADVGSTATEKKQQCYFFDLKPDVSLLEKDTASKCCTVFKDKPNTEFRKEFELYMIGTFMRVLDGLEGHSIEDSRSHHQLYVAWMREKVTAFSTRETPAQLEQLRDDTFLESLQQRISSAGKEGQFYAGVGPHVLGVLRGEVDPLAILFETGLAKGLYQDLNARLEGSLSSLLDLLAHKNPSMKIIEVGAGTGGTSAIAINSLVKAKTARFAQYDYTDISAAFFESAKDMFESTVSKMDFKVLDASADPAKQGFELGTYDLVVAANVLHATESLDVTLRNVHSLLKPGGKLVLIEVTSNVHQGGFAMGLLPGWWLSTEEYRKGGPCISENQWNDVLRNSGFSGLDMALRDFQDEVCHEQSILVSTALNRTANGIHAPDKTTILIDPESKAQRDMAKMLQDTIQPSTILPLATASEEQLDHAFCISLLDLDRPHMASMQETFFSQLNRVLTKASGILWVSMDYAMLQDKARLRLVDGLRRVLASENDDLRFVTLALEESTNSPSTVARISQIYETTVEAPTGMFEEDYTEKDGLLCIKRISEASPLNSHIEKQTSAPVAEVHAFGNAPPLRLEFESPGVLDSIRFIEDERLRELSAGQVELEVQATGLNFRDCLIALGRMKDAMKSIGFEVAGIVTRTGPESEFVPGDRVYGLVPAGCFSTFAVADQLVLATIPESMSFAEAAGLPTGMLTAYHSLVRVANLQPDESVLIHSAAGGTGQLALQIAQHIGAEIYVTVGTEDKKSLMMEQYHIPAERIFSSRSTAFASHLKRATNGRGVDVILNSLTDEKLVATWECVAPYGRMVEIGKKDVFANAKLPMLPFAKNVSYSVVDIFGMAQERPQMIRSVFQKAHELVVQKRVQVPQPLHVYGVGKVEDAFRYMQSGQNSGKIVVEMRKGDEVKALIPLQPRWMFSANASYLLAGGFGGIARSTARWMADRGARHFIILSRSGVRPGKSQELVTDLEKLGVRVAAPKCDVSDAASLRAALDSCKELGMPPVKGCIQGSMTLQDALFQNMTLDEWKTTVDPRVRGTWNLHTLLPQGMDFFILFSSVAGIVGSAGQANYAASNNYLDEFARYRLSIGEKATSFNLGWMQSEGVIAENENLARAWIVAGCWIPVSQPDLFALLDYYCDPSASHSLETAQVMIGLGPPALAHSKGITDLPSFFTRPLFRHLHQMRLDGPSSSLLSSADGGETDFAALFRSADTPDEAAEHVVEALVQRVAKAMAMAAADVDSRKPLHTYGVDSLLAIELRTWFKKGFGVDVAVFDLIGAKDFYAVAEKVAGLKGK
ncbi:hypothetical protein BDV95DRAFT_508906 [Massariosphaeria phaeospora]|uniref:Uncharacterized protein n=1 Tax=Massariosphaeria phaeospora TaxID=100035 RepID=A0A7C8MDV1_9PLEO|nr:hypothetical protein BDV95DRAFT_508906 [Massariosphaeria phaeospora]